MISNQTTKIRRSTAQYFFGGIGLALLSFVCFRLELGLATTAFVYLILITLLSLTGSFIESAMLSTLAGACLTYFFVSPIFSFRVDYPQDIVLVIAFLLTALTVTRFIGRARKHTQAALRAGAALRRSETYLAQAQRLSRTGSFGWRVANGEIFWSEETFRIFQYELTTTPTVELILRRTHPEDAAFVQQCIERASQDGMDLDFEYRLLMPDGSVKHVQVVAHALSDESGELEFVGAVMDVTAAKEAEQRLRQNERELRITVETIPAFVVSTQADGSVDFVSQSWVDYAGLSSEEWLGSAWMNAIHPEDRDRAVNKWRMALALGEAVELEVRFRRGECCSKCATSTYFGSAFILRILALTPKGLSRSRANPRGSSSIELFSRTDQ